MTGHGMNIILVNAALPHNLLGLDAVLVGILLIIQIMQKAYNPPLLLILPVAAGKTAHYAFDGQPMLHQRIALIVLPKQFPRILSCQAHFISSSSSMVSGTRASGHEDLFYYSNLLGKKQFRHLVFPAGHVL